MKTTLTLAICAALGALAHADTTITISTNVITPAVKRFGIDLAQINYYDSNQQLKEHIHNNPGFEGILYQSIVQIGSGTATNAIENGPFTQWASGFWAGAEYEFVDGAAKGRRGMLANNVNPHDLAGDPNGTRYIFGDSNTPPAFSDWMILRKSVNGAGAGGAENGWLTSVTGNGAIFSETKDLPPPPTGKQCIRLSAPAAGDHAAREGRVGGALRRDLFGRRHRLGPGADRLPPRGDHALGVLQPQLELAHVDGLGQVVVGAGLEGLDDVGLALLRRQQQDVAVLALRGRAQAPADLDAVEAGHHPVEQHQPRRVVALKDRPGLLPVGHDGRVVPPTLEVHRQQAPHDAVIVGDEDSPGLIHRAG